MQPLFARPVDVTAHDLWLMRWEAEGTGQAVYGVIQLDTVVEVDTGLHVRYTDFRDMGLKVMTLAPVPGADESATWLCVDHRSGWLMLTLLDSLNHPVWEVTHARRALDGRIANLARHARTQRLAGLYHQARLNWQRQEDESVLTVLHHAAMTHRERAETRPMQEAVELMLAIAQQLFTDGRLVQAADFYKTALLDFPETERDAIETVAHAEALAACGEWVPAVRVIQVLLGRIERHDGGRLTGHRAKQLRMILPMRMAAIFRHAGDLEGAAVALQECLDVAYEDAQRIDRDHVRLATEQLAGVLEADGRLQDALEYYERLKLLAPVGAHLTRIRVLRRRTSKKMR